MAIRTNQLSNLAFLNLARSVIAYFLLRELRGFIFFSVNSVLKLDCLLI
jgi:hypothetical protein